MADNYLERKRRDYEERKKEWIKKKKLHLKLHQKQVHKCALTHDEKSDVKFQLVKSESWSQPPPPDEDPFLARD